MEGEGVQLASIVIADHDKVRRDKDVELGTSLAAHVLPRNRLERLGRDRVGKRAGSIVLLIKDSGAPRLVDFDLNRHWGRRRRRGRWLWRRGRRRATVNRRLLGHLEDVEGAGFSTHGEEDVLTGGIGGRRDELHRLDVVYERLAHG